VQELTTVQALQLIDHNLGRLAGTRQDHAALSHALSVLATAAGLTLLPQPPQAAPDGQAKVQ